MFVAIEIVVEVAHVPVELIVYNVEEVANDGVPDITPVDVLNDKPVGNDGLMVYPVGDPTTVGVKLFIVEPKQKLNGDPE